MGEVFKCCVKRLKDVLELFAFITRDLKDQQVVMMRKTGMIVCTNPNKFSGFLPQIKERINTTLYVQFLPKSQLSLIGVKGVSLTSAIGPKFSPTMQQMYKSSVCLDLDVRVLLGAKRPIFTIPTRNEVEIVYFDVDLNKDVMEGFIRNRLDNRSSTCEPVRLSDVVAEAVEPEYDGAGDDEESNFVALGGTFDRLHVGHKMLLSEAALLAKQQLLVGLTDIEMLKTKTLWELIQPYNKRAENLRLFLQEIQPSLEVNIVPLTDVYGPTKDDPKLQVLIVSPETVKGGQKVNEMRQKNGLSPLKIRCIDLVNEGNRCWDVEEEKISSSNGRLRLLGTLLKAPAVMLVAANHKKLCRSSGMTALQMPNRPRVPYVIGLTGGIASGKTSVSHRLAKYGATVIDADKVAHSVYSKTEPGYVSVVKHFGESIVDPKTKEIDRKKLGAIVFNDRRQLEALNQLLWPLTLQKCEGLISKAASEGARIVVVEASLLVEAGWDQNCHEVWTCLIPVPEAIKRVQQRNKMSLEDATARVNSQISNLERVPKANVVFSTLWPPEYTDLQVERAWKLLLERLPKERS